MNHKISEDRRTLTISVDEKERQELRDWPEDQAGMSNENLQSDMAMTDFLEPLTCNSDLEWINPADTGDLTDAPMLGIYERSERARNDRILERWGFMDYQVRSVLEDLRDKGEVVFVGGAV